VNSGPSSGYPAKAAIVAELGERELLTPAQVNEALAANDRAKYLMTLLQAARAHADTPNQLAGNRERERLAAGVDEAGFDSVMALSRKWDNGAYVIPGARRIRDRLVDEIRRMIAPPHPGRLGDIPWPVACCRLRETVAGAARRATGRGPARAFLRPPPEPARLRG